MKWLALAVAALVTPSVATTAAELRLVSEVDFEKALLGCWSQAPSGMACFNADGTVFSLQIVGDHGGDGSGRFELKTGRLILRSDTDFWVFSAPEMTCDAIVLPREKLELRGCIGGVTLSEAEPIADAEFKSVERWAGWREK